MFLWCGGCVLGVVGQWTAFIDAAMKACNSRTTSNAQRVAKWTLLPTDFSVEGERHRHRCIGIGMDTDHLYFDRPL